MNNKQTNKQKKSMQSLETSLSLKLFSKLNQMIVSKATNDILSSGKMKTRAL